MKDLYRYLEVLQKHPTITFAMATVISIAGSAYRQEGAKMLLGSKGERYGTISAGCLEEDLLHRALEVIDNKEAIIQPYDLRSEEDAGWGVGAGCNGKIEVFIEPVCWDEFWRQVYVALQNGETLLSVRGVSGEVKGSRLCITEQGECISDSEEIKTNTVMNMVKTFLFEGYFFEYQNGFMFERYEPKENLYIFGAGSDVEPLVPLAASLDFSPIIIDPRSDRCCRERFPDATELIVKHPETYLCKREFKSNSFVLLMTHHFERDQQILSYFIKNRPRYLGILGPKSRTDKLMFPEEVPPWVHSPVGLSIDAEGAEEISISIIGQLIQVRNANRAKEKKKKRQRNVFKETG
ncbi:XdhC family protein [Bacillus alkalicellulosilyticus]|uniref:XdhC family protein n=1 Tax=Alkalihalobacterium alkalicellulosilyticum TaxID=1912214 RepID=UPI001483171A|nr:XdhC family protein [Bacillus alkalicellulosilyticus]